MTLIKPPVSSPPEKAAPTATTGEKICPRCGKPLRAEYTCGCLERWENEGGAPAPDGQGLPETYNA
jgi:predicted amidophosphoribosyltransferase